MTRPTNMTQPVLSFFGPVRMAVMAVICAGATLMWHEPLRAQGSQPQSSEPQSTPSQSAQPPGAQSHSSEPQSALPQSPQPPSGQSASDPPPPTHLEPLSLGQLGAVPWGYSPTWFLLIALGVPTLTWLGFAWKRALDEDPHRFRRKALRELRGQLALMQRGGSAPAQPQLHGWCRAAARTWGVHVLAPTTEQVTESVATLSAGNKSLATTWRELWLVTDRGLYAPPSEPPSDWLQRACAAAQSVQVPKRERWLPNRLAHWLPSVTAALLLTVCGLTCLLAGSAISAATAPTVASQDDQKAAVAALRANWTDWAAHYNIAAAQMHEGNWNYAVAHATAAFVLDPSQAFNRDNLRFASQQAGTLDPTLRRFLYGAWFQRFPTLFSPAAWQRWALAASCLIAAGLTTLVLVIYVPHLRGYTRVGPRSALAIGVVLFALSVSSYDAYGTLSRPAAGILLTDVNLSPSPTELVPEQDMFPATAGSVTLPRSAFLGWQQVAVGPNIVGWLRKNTVMPLYTAPRRGRSAPPLP
jgi:hypothetical protein